MKRKKEFMNIILGNDDIMSALKTVDSLNLPNWWLAGGCIRNIFFDLPIQDYDVIYFDSSDLNSKIDHEYAKDLEKLDPSKKWNVVNQARIHLWPKSKFGVKIERSLSSEDSIRGFPEKCTCIGLKMLKDKVIVFAPYGVDDLFERKIEWNPYKIDYTRFYSRILTVYGLTGFKVGETSTILK